MNYIERLLTGAIEKNIGAKPKCGNYRIDIEYIKGGVEYVLIKKDMRIATVTKFVDNETVQVKLSPIIDDSDTDRLFFAVKNCFGNFEIFFKN